MSFYFIIHTAFHYIMVGRYWTFGETSPFAAFMAIDAILKAMPQSFLRHSMFTECDQNKLLSQFCHFLCSLHQCCISVLLPFWLGGGSGPIRVRICTDTLAPPQEANKLKKVDIQTSGPQNCSYFY
jgi:hypothetical protein